jgi:hypothetical protein
MSDALETLLKELDYHMRNPSSGQIPVTGLVISTTYGEFAVIDPTYLDHLRKIKDAAERLISSPKTICMESVYEYESNWGRLVQALKE